MKKFFSVLLALAGPVWAAAASSLEDVKQRGVLRWGADAEGGAPYVFHDPAAPDRLLGFEVELAEELARRLAVRPQLVQENWDMLVPALKQGAFDVILNGLERTPENHQKLELSRPYFVYHQQIITRADTTQIKSLDDLKGRTVAALSGSVSFRILAARPEINMKIYSGNAQSFQDLKIGRLDAVIVDSPVASHFARNDPELRFGGPPFAPGYYAIGLPLGDAELLGALDKAIGALLANGTLERIYRKYDLWGPEQAGLAQVRLVDAPREGPSSTLAHWQRYLPLLLRASLTTIWLTVAGMGLAMALGLAIALSRLYGPRTLRWIATAYTEVMRGTPLLIQLYFIYYGLAQQLGLRMGEYAAAVLALGLNYAANEAENYRAGINAVARGQWEAATALGMSRWLTLRRIILPQAFRLVVPPVSNDFIAMFKDSSIVSVIAIVELTKEYQIRATDTGDYLGLGVMTAALYFGMSYAASLLMQRFEHRLQHDHR
jgi:polar amino acid transport system substrate-binding protein